MKRSWTSAPCPHRSQKRLDSERWRYSWSDLGLVPRTGLLAEVAEAWKEPWRAYHTIDHLEAGLHLLSENRHLAEKPAELDLAFYFHDVVYDPKRFDNEEKSAELAKKVLLEAGATPELAQRIYDLVMVTKHDAEPADADAALLVDVDLAILGAGREEYDRYEKAVREEYAWVPRFLFRRKRREILRAFLARPRIYRTAALHERLEAAARDNLTRAIAALG
jgi:predicted metal-dependent HD superfamily phosphohydrolase